MAEFDTTEFLTHHVNLGQNLSSVFEDDGESLSHYQIKGAKHGIRRFQNFDGTLTDAGRERYGIGPPREKKSSDGESNAKKTYEKVKQKVKDRREFKDAKRRNKLKEYLRDHPKKLPRYKRVITQDEADEIISKINFDRKLKDVKNQETDRRRDRFAKFVGTVGDIKTLYQHGSTMYNQTANIYNAMLSAGKVNDNGFHDHQSEMLKKYGENFKTLMTPDELKTYNELKVVRDNKLWPTYNIVGGGKKK